MTLVPLPAFADNNIWMLQDGRDAIMVGPVETGPVFRTPERRGLQLAAILVTHRHADRNGGVEASRRARCTPAALRQRKNNLR
jgi:hydroxyacylglutathione hydrolase